MPLSLCPGMSHRVSPTWVKENGASWAMQFHVAAYLTALGLATTHLFIPSMSILIPFLHAFPCIWNFPIFHLPCSSAFFSCQLNRAIWEKLPPPYHKLGSVPLWYTLGALHTFPLLHLFISIKLNSSYCVFSERQHTKFKSWLLSF